MNDQNISNENHNETKKQKTNRGAMVLRVMAKKAKTNINRASEESKKVLRAYSDNLELIPAFNDLNAFDKMQFAQSLKENKNSHWQSPMIPQNCQYKKQSQPQIIALSKDFSYEPQTSILRYKGKDFMNCMVEIVEIIKKPSGNSYVCKVTKNGEIIIKEPTVSKFADMLWLKDIEGFTFLCEKNKVSDIAYHYSQLIILNLNGCKKSVFEATPGWKKIGDTYVYITPNGTIGNSYNRFSENGQNFSSITPTNQGFRKYLSCVKLTTSPTAAILILYTAMSLCYSLFKEAEVQPKFIVFLTGERGTRKTAISLALTQIEYSSSPKYILKSTPSALEAGFNEYSNAVMVVDDLSPAPDRAVLSQLTSNLELLVRVFGDATGKRRNYDFLNEKKQQYVTNGLCVVTGEFVTGCQSSLARCLILENKKGEIDLSMLTRIQQDKHYVEDFAVDFIYHMTMCMKQFGSDAIIKDMIQKHTLYYREVLQERASNPRYIEYFAQLNTTSELIMNIAKFAGLLTDQEIKEYKKIFDEALNEVILKNSNGLALKSPEIVLCNSIIYGIESGRLHLIEYGKLVSNQNNYVIEDESFYYISQSTCCILYNDYIKLYKLDFPQVTPRQVADMLLNLKVIDKQKEGQRLRNAIKINGYGNKRYMLIKKSELYKYLDE